MIAVNKNSSAGGKSLPDPGSSDEEVLLDLDGGLVGDLKVQQLDPQLFQLNSIRRHLGLYTKG